VVDGPQGPGIEGKPIVEAVAMSRDLLANSPKHGSRTTFKSQSVAPADTFVEEPTPELGIVVFEGMP
jgi:hypothetical protein